MSFPRYPAYKDSGVEWLGEVPEHWNVLPLRRLVREVASGTSVNAVDEPAGPNQAGVLKTSCVYTGEFRPEENKAIIEAEIDRASCPVAAGCLVVSRMNTPDLVGAAGFVKDDAPFLFLPDRLWQVSFHDCDPKFMNYWCKSTSYRSQVHLACSGTSSSMQNLSQDNFYSFIAPVPPSGEQHCITTFLDRETAKIDALIAEQQRLIELLQEKRQAVISHAVTKGLNPDAPMKDSGVEWLGEVPEHWAVSTIKRIVSTPVTDGPHETPEFLDEGIPFVSAEAVSTGKIDFERIRGFISLEDHQRYSQKYRPKRDDIFMIKSGATTGTSAVVETDIEFNIWSPLAVIRCGSEVLPRFALHFIRSRNFLEAVALGWSFGTQQNIGIGVIENLSIVVPPLEEQRELVSLLDSASDEANSLIVQAERSTALLQERRSALISAAVTGKIDVRALVPDAEAA